MAVLLLLGALALQDPAKVPAFPGAEGAGAFTPGGRGGKVLRVTTLEDYDPDREKPVPGSFRAAVSAKGPRLVVFRVSGLITLQAPLKIREPFLTIAGQTAPGGGVCLRNYGCVISETHDVVVRHLRFRPGDPMKKELDALSVLQSRDVILDHCSASWATDEVLSVTGEGCSNVTVQWCFITEALDRSHHSKGEHGYGSLLRVDGDVSFHHNLYAHHRTRCPRPGTYGAERGIHLDFRNNAIYDWISPAGYTSEDRATLNYVGNYLKPGPSTKDRRFAFKIGGAGTRMFVADNVLEGVEAADAWSLIAKARPANKAGEAIALPPVRTDAPADAYSKVLEGAGATLPRRDAADLRVAEAVREGKGKVINSQEEVGGWPEYAGGEAPADEDEDGMPDAWERANGLDPATPEDAPADKDGDGYTNVEEYLNGTDPQKG